MGTNGLVNGLGLAELLPIGANALQMQCQSYIDAGACALARLRQFDNWSRIGLELAVNCSGLAWIGKDWITGQCIP